MPHVLFLVPEMYSANGGVQAYMRRLAEILSLYDRGAGSQLDCMSLADSNYLQERHSVPVDYGEFVGTNRSKVLFTIRALQIAARHRPSVAIVGHVGLVPVALALKLLGLIRDYIVVLHGTEAWKRLGLLDRLASRRARWIVSTTAFTANHFCSDNAIPLHRTRIIPLAVPPPEPEDSPALTDPAEGQVLKVLTVSRLHQGTKYKGIDSLIDAVARARKAQARVTLTIAGDGDDVPRLRNLAHTLELHEHVHFRGSVRDKELAALYRECDVFAMPSKGEGFGIVFLEAMSYGKPCIGGNHGGTPEVIDDGYGGFLVEHGDVDQLTARLIELWADPEMRKMFGERARRKVLDRFQFTRMRDDWFDLLNETTMSPARHRMTDTTRAAQTGNSVGV